MEVSQKFWSLVALELAFDYAPDMTTTLRDFIAQREADIRDQQKALKTELRELLIAKSALDAQPPTSASAAGSSNPTIKDMAREVLSGQPNGLNSSGILDGIRKLFARDIERTSLSPQLSRLKDEGELILNGEVWFTAEHFEAHEARRRSVVVAESRTSSGWGQPIGQSSSFSDDLDDDAPF